MIKVVVVRQGLPQLVLDMSSVSRSSSTSLARPRLKRRTQFPLLPLNQRHRGLKRTQTRDLSSLWLPNAEKI